MKLITNEPTAQFVAMTKAIVDSLQSMDTHNRAKKRDLVAFYVDQIKSGNWTATNQGIGVSSDGILVDGGHRIEALKQAGYPPVTMLVVTGLSRDAQQYVDCHARRSMRDRLKLAMDITMNSKLSGAVQSGGCGPC